MLIGEYIHTIDNKNRVSLPAKFRKEMGKSLVVTPGLDNCLFIFTKKEWVKISEKLSEFSMLTADNRSFNRFMFGGATEVDVDNIGRFLLPDFLKTRAGLSDRRRVLPHFIPNIQAAASRFACVMVWIASSSGFSAASRKALLRVSFRR